MKTTFFTTLFFLILAGSGQLAAQDIEFPSMDKSPMDAAHYPDAAAYRNYLDEDSPYRRQIIKVLYSRPQVNDRDIFGSLIPYGEDYRLGANEATEVTFFQNVEIGGTHVAGGIYTIFAEPYPNQWIIKISKQRFIGGSANRDVSMDVVSVAIPVERVAESREYFTIGFQKIDDNNVHMIFAWDNTQASLPINLNPAVMDGEDVSPMDLVQFPNMSRLRNFVKEEELEANEPQVRVVYARPTMKGRKIFGELLEYGKVWRVGANETTEITFFKDVEIGGKRIRAGRYGLFAKVNKDNWEFIIHSNVQSWGPANHDDEDNIVKVTASTEKTPETLEALSMTFVDKGDGNLELVIGWENTMARLPIMVK
ncbi:hypothetical protein CEQ90_17265 [Lewinellaceae bacterium SD302]|nr:hypothetical protein CEQ90_17265 [Lewinellaceae bacterium SD302]